MVKKTQKRDFSVDEKKKYHTERIKSAKTTDNQKVYSRNWLDGFIDENAEFNLKGSKQELKNNQEIIKAMERDIANQKREVKSCKTYNKINLGAYINGATANKNK